MGKLNTSHLIEAVAWVGIAALFFIYSFEFNQKIEIYKFGATAWPRSILLMLMLVIAGNLFYQRANGSTPQPGRVGISEDDLDDAEKPLSSYLNIGSFLFLPLIFAFCIAVSRVLVSAHYPSDVAGGMAIGIMGAWFFISRLKEQISFHTYL